MAWEKNRPGAYAQVPEMSKFRWQKVRDELESHSTRQQEVKAFFFFNVYSVTEWWVIVENALDFLAFQLFY